DRWGTPASVTAFGPRGVDVPKARSWAAGRQREGRPALVLATAFALVQWLESLERQDLRLRLPAGSVVFETGGLNGPGALGSPPRPPRPPGRTAGRAAPGRGPRVRDDRADQPVLHPGPRRRRPRPLRGAALGAVPGVGSRDPGAAAHCAGRRRVRWP